MAKTKKRKKVLRVVCTGALVLGGFGLGMVARGLLDKGLTGEVVSTNIEEFVQVFHGVRDTYGDKNCCMFGGATTEPIPTSELGKLAEGIRLAFGDRAEKATFTHFIAVGPAVAD